MRPAVFLDRDGTINEEVGYLHEVERLSLIPGAALAIKRLNDHGLLAVCISNQSGVARGYHSEDAVLAINKRLVDLLGAEGARLDGIYFCPHHPTEGEAPYRIDCGCRKPGTGMIEQAVSDLSVDLSRSFLIGDRVTDIETAHHAGVKGVLVLTGYGAQEYGHVHQGYTAVPDHVSRDIGAAVDWILRNQTPSS
ncbi:MAG: D-glycero-alpha-D-manno-heptose-1,7-bisphosphate 7-phosphatase [bacterium]